MAKLKSFLAGRATTPTSASDADFVMAVNPSASSRRTFSQNIAAERIRPNPFQARQTFKNLEELAAAIGAQGFTSRLRVRPDPNQEGFFQLVYGERRLRAARLAGLEEIPCDVANHSDEELIEIGLAENIQRENLDPMEEAQAFQQLIERGRYSIRQLAERLGKNKDYVSGRLALLNAPADVQELVLQKPDAVTAARRIAQLPNQEQRKPLIDALLKGELSKEAVRTSVQQTINPVRPDVQKSVATLEKVNEEIDKIDLADLSGSNNSAKLVKETSEDQSAKTVRPDVQKSGSDPELKGETAKTVRPDVQKLGLEAQIEQEAAAIQAILGQWREILPGLDAGARNSLLARTRQLTTLLQKFEEN